jgi:hypothetical protein
MALRTASVYRIADLTVHARGDRMSDYDTSLLLATFPETYLWTSGRIQTESYGFALPENLVLPHEPDFDFLHGFSGQFSTQNSL